MKKESKNIIEVKDRDTDLAKANDKQTRQKESSKSSVPLAIISISICLVVAIVCGTYIWNRKMTLRTQESIRETVEELIASGQFDDARDEAARNSASVTPETLKDMIRYEIERIREEERIDRKEEEHRLQNGITIGRKAGEFVGLSKDEVYTELIERGFNEESVILTPMPSNARKYRKMEEVTVLSVAINGKEKFDAKDKFYSSDVIEIYYHVKYHNN